MALALCAAAISAVAVFLTTFCVIRLQAVHDQETSRAFETYKLDAAKMIATAQERAASAELKTIQLRKELGPREFNRDVFLREIADTKPSSVEILFLRDDPECQQLAQQISLALQAAKWTVVPPRPIPNEFIGDLPTAMTVNGQPSGVTVVTHSITPDEAKAMEDKLYGRPWPKTAWTVLSQALGDSVGKVSASAGGQFAPPEGLLRIVVAPR